jgi:tetratricopeptide (TPR) repeat protein
MWQQLARGFAERGERHLRNDDPDAAWLDLVQAEQMQSGDAGVERLRQALTALGLAQVRAQLQAGEPGRAVETLDQLRDRLARHPDLQPLEEAAKAWVLARDLADRGEFARAEEALERARRGLLLRGPVTALDQFRAQVAERERSYSRSLIQLHEATEQNRWRDVLELSEQVLEAAPQHKEARRVRSLAWRAVQPVTVALAGPAPQTPSPTSEEPPRRFLLWVDGVGGYLVCLSARITLGQATPDAFVDVPLFADVSRLHAALTRDGEGYVLEAVRAVQVNGRPSEKAILRPGDRITLGSCCQFIFRQPSAVSTTARLDLVSGHRLPIAVDGVLLMADALLLGPGPQMHVTVPQLKQPVVLFRHKDGLGVRYGGNLIVDGRPCRDRCVLSPAASVAGDDFAFALEPAGTRMGLNPVG